MQISDIKIVLVPPNRGLIAFASFVLGNCLHIDGIAIHEKLDGMGYRLTYPTRKKESRDFYLYHPINRQFSRAIEQAVFEKLKSVLNQGRNDAGYHCHQPAES